MSESLSFLASAFDASGRFFASAVASLDLNKIQITPAAGSQSSNALQTDYTLPNGVTVQTLIWIHASLGKSGLKKVQKKKRKRSLTTSGTVPDPVQSSDIENALVAIGTNKGDILIFSPAQSTVLFTLSGVHAVPVISLAADSISGTQLWSCDSTGRVGEWDLTTQKSIRSFVFPESDVSLLHPVSTPNHTNGLLLASNTIYLVDSNNPQSISKTFPSFIHPTSSLIPSSKNPDILFASSHNERNVGILSYTKEKTVGLLVAQSDIKQLVVNSDSSAVCVVTEDGFVEVFSEPLDLIADKSSHTPKSKSRKSQAVVSLPSTATIKIFRPSTQPKNRSLVKIQNAWFQDSHLIITWAEHGSIPVFEQVKWRDDSNTAISGLIELTKSVKVISGSQSQDSVDSAAAARYHEANTLFKSGSDFSKLETANQSLEQADSEDEEEGGTLADRLDALEVSDAKNKSSEDPVNATSLTSKRPMKTPESFSIILAQSLKTNDHTLLETCLSNKNEEFIQTSVKRLDSSLAVVLLERIAEKVARTPTRTASLTIWIKWVIITHGGYLVSLPNLAKSLASLHSTLANKISMLPRLLALQGRVEMLRAQMKLRREIMANGTNNGLTDNLGDESDVDSEVEYIEDAALIVNGEEDFDDGEEEDDGDITMDASGFIELEAEESDNSDSEDEEEDEGMSDVEAEGVLSDDGIEFDEDEESDEIPVKSKSSKKKATKSFLTNGKSRR